MLFSDEDIVSIGLLEMPVQGHYSCNVVLSSCVALFSHKGIFSWTAAGGLSQASTVVALCCVVVLYCSHMRTIYGL